jgi:hypothetical protein
LVAGPADLATTDEVIEQGSLMSAFDAVDGYLKAVSVGCR